MKIVKLTNEESIVVTEAIQAGAFAERHKQLTALLVFNKAHNSIANGIELEINALDRAASAICNAKEQ
jgi:hypothetical protein